MGEGEAVVVGFGGGARGEGRLMFGGRWVLVLDVLLCGFGFGRVGWGLEWLGVVMKVHF